MAFVDEESNKIWERRICQKLNKMRTEVNNLKGSNLLTSEVIPFKHKMHVVGDLFDDKIIYELKILEMRNYDLSAGWIRYKLNKIYNYYNNQKCYYKNKCNCHNLDYHKRTFIYGIYVNENLYCYNPRLKDYKNFKNFYQNMLYKPSNSSEKWVQSKYSIFITLVVHLNEDSFEYENLKDKRTRIDYDEMKERLKEFMGEEELNKRISELEVDEDKDPYELIANTIFISNYETYEIKRWRKSKYNNTWFNPLPMKYHFFKINYKSRYWHNEDNDLYNKKNIILQYNMRNINKELFEKLYPSYKKYDINLNEDIQIKEIDDVVLYKRIFNIYDKDKELIEEETEEKQSNDPPDDDEDLDLPDESTSTDEEMSRSISNLNMFIPGKTKSSGYTVDCKTCVEYQKLCWRHIHQYEIN
tara:strand:- start:59 stop:1300 length:1242 start_codon:yes stop_codon:yes gene_type:complete